MFQRRPHRSAPRTRSLALGGALAALAVVGGGTVVAVSAPTEVAAGDILLAQNTVAQEMRLGEPIQLDLEPVVANAAGGAIPAGTTVQVTGLPDGLTQDEWVISGTPTRAGDYDVLVTVSNGAASRSEKLTVTVTETPGAAGTNRAATTADSPDVDDETGADTSPGDGTAATTGDESVDTAPAGDGQAGPRLSAAAGDPELQNDETGVTVGDDEVGTSPDLCAVLGDGGTDGASLTRLLPALTGGEDEASSGLVLVLVNAIVGMLPSVLGESGSMDDLGSAGQILCTLAPSLLGGDAAGQAATEGGAGATAGLGGAPAALLGLFTGGGSLGD